ncbi:Beta-2 adrenergic receptor [Trichoplax sp. H2]|uniref:G-protein coupled receptors family 1 profile domain-containing protein n=1 Tax=Trichoplax adhaerens TaxID=10228 RepID=B3RXY0_TRIAD|nr:hypothetical protein TRIADDRAFT_56368 [Trichoplax adhaerens]EDV24938.1 hypothetical protein TRIADDRAFT_56368 [Trichoplax adhaerens]RDD46780.1 Beta-2 adrenergic receptor [Trichoplax sp. H2]|eukprot:XP_002112828.1 hypothetical protein TRIADDRAFT_56368 [Trichoplax adhaerens]
MANTSAVNSSLENPRTNDGYVFTQVYWSVTGALTVVTNTSLLLLILLRRKLWTFSHRIIASMAFVGILFGAIYILPRWANPDGLQTPILCDITRQIGQSLVINLNIHICVISFDRYFAVMYPFNYPRQSTTRNLILLLISIWSIATVVPMLPLVTFRPVNATYCTIWANDLVAEKAFLFAIFSILFFLPLVVILLTYTRIISTSYSHRQRMNSFNQKMTRRRSLSIIIYDIKALRQMAILLCTFCLGFCPFVIMFIIQQEKISDPRTQVRSEALVITSFIAFSYPALNPLMYGYFSPDIRSECFKVFCKMFTFSKYNLETTSTSEYLNADVKTVTSV